MTKTSATMLKVGEHPRLQFHYKLLKKSQDHKIK